MMILKYGYGDGYGNGSGYGDAYGNGYGGGDGNGSGNGYAYGDIGARWRLFESFIHHADHVMPLLNCAGLVPDELNTTLPVGDIYYDDRL